MSADKQTFFLVHDMARGRAVEAVRTAPEGYVVRIEPPKKSRDQEEKYHAMFSDVARCCDFNGMKLPAESWKRLLVEAFVQVKREEARGTGQPDPFPRGRVLPSLDGLRIVQVEVLTRTFKKREASEFIEFLLAWGAERDVHWTNPVREEA